jgi:hypothetical protein
MIPESTSESATHLTNPFDHRIEHGFDTEWGRQCLAAGMDDYLAKPFSTVGLSATVSKWISSPPPPSAAGGMTKVRPPQPDIGAEVCAAIQL